MKFRHELKYLINYYDYTYIKMRLNHILPVDPHAGTDGSYTVRSLYFDDYYNRAYNDKLSGSLTRSKYRIRLYNYEESTIHLERKIKSSHYNHKYSAKLTRAQVDLILTGDYGFLPETDSNLLKVFYHECISNFLRPRVVVDYEREAYLMDAGDVRITFDKNVRAGVEGFDIFNREMAMVEALDPGLLIMEVKYTELLPNLVRRLLPSNTADYLAVSKFLLCCDRTLYKHISSM